MSDRNTIARSLHDVGLAAWFGGSLMGATGLNEAATAVDDPRQRARVANAGWDKWTPINLAAIGVHVAGAVKLTYDNKARIATQQGVAGMSTVKAGLTVAALAATGYSRILGRKMSAAGDVPVAGGTAPISATPPEVAKAQDQLKVLQWVIPALTGGLLVANAYAGEQQRPSEVAKGVAGRAVQAVMAAPAATAAKAIKAVA